MGVFSGSNYGLPSTSIPNRVSLPGGISSTQAALPFSAGANVSPTIDVAGSARDAVAAARQGAALAGCEAQLVRDVLLAAQGVNGDLLVYARSRTGEGFQIKTDPEAIARGGSAAAAAELPRTAVGLTKRLAELGWLFRRIATFVGESPGSGTRAGARSTTRVAGMPSSPGMITGSGTTSTSSSSSSSATQNALRAALEQELSQHYRMLAQLQEQVVAAERAGRVSSSSSNSSSADGGMTLRRLSAWLAEPLERLQFLAVLADVGGQAKGGALLRALGELGWQGTPLARGVVASLQRRVALPILEMIARFCCEGILSDPHGEFFVLAKAPPRDWPQDPHTWRSFDLWAEGYHLLDHLVPPFLAPDVARDVLRAGKTANFLRLCCDDTEWERDPELLAYQQAMYRHVAHDEAVSIGLTGSSHPPHSTLADLIRKVALHLDARLLHIMTDRFRLRSHLEGIKRYVLLAQGDFSDALIELLGGYLNQPAADITESQLQRSLQQAVMASNAQYDDRDVVDRLALRLLVPPSTLTSVLSGWDCLALEYDLGRTLSTVIPAPALAAYADMSRRIVQLRKVERELSEAWRQLKPNGFVLRSEDLRGTRRLSPDPSPEVQFKRRFAALVQRVTPIRARMAHFVTSLQTYLSFEVLEVEWHALQSALKNATDLDRVIAAHRTYLKNVGSRMLMGQSVVLARIDDNLKIVLAFAGAVRDLEVRLARLSAHAALMGYEDPERMEGVVDEQRNAMLVALAEDTQAMQATVWPAMERLSARFVTGVESLFDQCKAQTTLDLKTLMIHLEECRRF